MLEYNDNHLEQTRHPIIQKHKEILQKMADRRVVGIIYSDGEFGIKDVKKEQESVSTEEKIKVTFKVEYEVDFPYDFPYDYPISVTRE